MSIKERAIEANKRFLKRTEDLFTIQSEMKFEEIFGDIKYEIEKSKDNLIIKSDGLVFYCECDDDGGTLLTTLKECPVCGEIYTQPFTSLAELGNRLETEHHCDECGEILEILSPQNAMKEIESCQKETGGYILNKNEICKHHNNE